MCNLEESGRYYPIDAENMNQREGFPDVAADSVIEASTRFYFLNEPVTVDNQVRKLNIVASDTAFFDIFPRNLVMGSKQLGDYQKVIVTSDIANELWPDEHPIGMKLRISPFDEEFEVSGVVDRPNTKAHFDFDIAMSLNDKQDIGRMGIMACRLIEGGEYTDFNKRSQPYIEDYGFGYTHYWHFLLEPLDGLYFNKNIETDIYLKLSGNKNAIYLLIAVGVALSVVGLFNFINIYGVVMTQRRRNFGIRKAFGAKEINFFIQIFFENLIISAVSVAVAWVIVAAVSPTLSKVFGVTQNASLAFDVLITAAMLLIFPLVVSLVTSFSLWRSARVHSMDNAESATSVSKVTDNSANSQTQEAPQTPQTAASGTDLGEIKVVGYGTVKKDQSGNWDPSNAKITPVTETPDTMHIRATADKEPPIVEVDGKEIPYDDINKLNPSDIESISVYKNDKEHGNKIAITLKK